VLITLIEGNIRIRQSDIWYLIYGHKLLFPAYFIMKLLARFILGAQLNSRPQNSIDDSTYSNLYFFRYDGGLKVLKPKF